MNRLQKKCAIVTVGAHLLLLTILIVGPAFFNPQPKPDNTQLLDVIPANLIDAALNSGVRQAAPAPVVTPPPQPTPPAPVIQPAPKPVVTPQPTFMDKVEKIFKPEPKPEPEKTETKPHQIQVNTQLVTRVAPKNSTSKPPPNTRAVNTALTTLRKNLSSPTEVNLPGDSTVAYANYASVVKSVYDQAWTLPDSIANDDENIKVTVTIASDGTVISARIREQAGDAPVDASVQRTLDRVTFVAPFPEGSADKQRTYIINFNPQIKKSE
jgi:periplasmic protein TonB